MKRLLLFETEAQLKKLLSRFDACNPENTWVALSPEADYAGEYTGLTYQQIEDFYDEAELIALGIENYKTVGDFCDTLDQILQSYLSNIPEVNYFSAHQSFHSWKILFDAILNRTFALKAVIENIKPNEIVSLRGANTEWRDGLGFSSGSAFRSVLPIVAEHYHIKLTQMPAPRIGRQPLIPRARVGWLLHQLPGGWRILNVLNWFRQEHSKLSNSDLNKGQPALVITELGHDVDYVVEKWRASSIGPVIMLGNMLRTAKIQGGKRQLLKRKLTEMWNSPQCHQRLAPYFNINRLDCYPIAYPRLHYFISLPLPQSLNHAQFTQHILEKLDRGVVLSIIKSLTCEVARHLGIPSATYQHGGFIGYMDAPIFEHMELSCGDYYFCYGVDIVKFLDKPVPSAHRSPDKHRAKPIAIGSAALDSLAQAKDKMPSDFAPNQTTKSRKVIYVPSSLMGDRRHHSYHICPDIWYWLLEREIIKIFGHSPEIQFIAKLHPEEATKNPIDDWFRHHPIPNVKIVRDVPFRNFLNDADLFIMDHPSTTLVQALTTNKKIILYADRTFFRFDPQALELVKKRVVFSETKEQFFRDIERVLGEDSWALPEPINDEFLRGYGTYLNDRRSAERAVQTLIDLAEKRSATTKTSS